MDQFSYIANGDVAAIESLYQQYLQPLVTQYFSMLGTEPIGILGLPSSVDVQKLLDSFKAGQ